MKDFKDKVAVITGAASGIGRSIAERCAQEDMHVVLADIEEKALAQTGEEMKAAGATVLTVVTDVSKKGDVEALAKQTLDAFGAVHLLCNNAGVMATDTVIWENTIADWNWTIGVNLWGAIHGVMVFMPIMLEQNTECHIVNTSSIAALLSYPFSGMYTVSKHAVLSLSEKLYHELAWKGAKIKVSVLLPGTVNTRIIDAERNRPAELHNDPSEEKELPHEFQVLEQLARQSFEAGMEPRQVADCVFNAIREEKFYIITHPDRKAFVQMRTEDILQERNPTNPFADLLSLMQGP
jgi:NAD(P)-dependent dehydrogenase (short-subunit alcohol dehydrogenase family)